MSKIFASSFFVFLFLRAPSISKSLEPLRVMSVGLSSSVGRMYPLLIKTKLLNSSKNMAVCVETASSFSTEAIV